MIRKFFLSISTIIFILLAFIKGAAAVTIIPFWHSMSGALGEQLQYLVNKFNATYPEYKIVATYKGNYDEVFALGVASYRNGNPPTILQIYDVGTATMVASKVFVPVETLLKSENIDFDPAVYIPTIRAYYSDAKTGELYSLPFYSSVPVLFYNKEMFVKAGLDPNKPPKTWQEVESYAEKLKAAGINCTYTASWFTWPHIENYTAWNGLSLASQDNGFNGYDVHLTLDNPLVINHLKQLQDMKKRGLFSYFGRGAEGQQAFYGGKCAMASLSSSNLASVQEYGKFDFGISQMPYDAKASNAPQNPLIGGGSLWVLKKQTPEQYRGAALFLAFLVKPENAAYWHEHTGYLPSVVAAYEMSKESGYYDRNPKYEVAIKELLNKPPLPQTRGIRLGYLPQIRVIIAEEIEMALDFQQTVEQAIANINSRSQILLNRFSKLYNQ